MGNRFSASLILTLVFNQAGLTTILSYGALVTAIYLFQRFLIAKNWRHTQFAGVFAKAMVGLLWLFAYYDIGGTRNAWYAIFIEVLTVRLGCLLLLAAFLKCAAPPFIETFLTFCFKLFYCRLSHRG